MQAAPDHRPLPPLLVLIPLACAAIAVPALLAFNIPPSATFLNQAVALGGWGALSAVMAHHAHVRLRAASGAGPLLWALALMAAAACASMLFCGLPPPLGLSAIGILLATLWVTSMAAAMRSTAASRTSFMAVCTALLLAGALSLVVGFVQYFAPQGADGTWIALAATPGRIGGNLRQPNHLSSLLLFSAIALLWLYGDTRLRGQTGARVLVPVLWTALMLGIVLTGSRTGAVCTLLLAAWGLVDRRLPREVRLLLWTAPLLYAALWFGMDYWAHHGSTQVFGGESQFKRSDISSSRFGIWANTLSLIRMHPWFGVGWGEFNFAWTLTPFPGRPSAFFDHTHNLPLQLLVEMGLPFGSLAICLLLASLWLAFDRVRRDSSPDAGMVRCALVMVLTMAIHSQLEYPLWYAYFLLPTAYLWGLCLGRPPVAGATTADEPAMRDLPRIALLVAPWLLMAGSACAVVDYLRVAEIFSPGERAGTLAQRIAAGQESLFFAHHADYAEATTAENPVDALAAYRRSTHYLLDARLMMSWAIALEASGDVDRARHVAQRLREFKNPQSDDWFAACDRPPGPQGLPFQCLPPSRELGFERFR